MVQKEQAKRGRPRAYDPDKALIQAAELFWDQGYAATSLDGLSEATGMNRPSLYGAFGDKKSLYLTALERYRRVSEGQIDGVFAGGTLREGLRRFYRGAIDLYMAGDHGARGCFLIGTATAEAVVDPEMRQMLKEALDGFDRQIEARLRTARDKGELPASADPHRLSKLVSAVLHSLAVRARAGDLREDLEATAAAAIDLICGPVATN